MRTSSSRAPLRSRPRVGFRLPRGPHVVDLSEPGLAILRRKADGQPLAVISRKAYDELQQPARPGRARS